MVRKRKKRIRQNQTIEQQKHIPWYKKVWVVAAATSALVSTILIQGPTMLQNARILPKEIKETSDQFQSWVKEDADWTGHWSSFPEGMVDMADLDLSDVDLEITIHATNGNIDGTIATKKICKSIPVFDFVLLRGKVNGNQAEVVAWDIIGGKKTDFASLTLVRDGYLMQVTPKEGMTSWFPTQARIARRPTDSKDPQPDTSYCAEEKKELYEQFIDKQKEHG
ncbi:MULTISPECIES: hypothetical protein [Vibrio]|uniref:Uncharacterized protein n=2 Tax=Vibrio TaxID=662 RepID=A0ABD7SP55_VIBCL|nr:MULTISPECIES: hypothetical protein [Vibrio]EKO3966630.1 hypothetical protein [Vibrio fluvialis]HAS8443597.1 hypothetical protein [Vibrio vulnificus]EII3728966.1 hypothetical protein [Vibrio cholerae]EJN2399876.1 hypothetical protein [Vibrio cholerae]EKF9154306.1 hypothetical protein [Vibrio cholerae]